MFVNTLKMLEVPLVIFSLICGVCGIGDIRVLGRVGGKSVLASIGTAGVLDAADGLHIDENVEAEMAELVARTHDQPDATAKASGRGTPVAS